MAGHGLPPDGVRGMVSRYIKLAGPKSATVSEYDSLRQRHFQLGRLSFGANGVTQSPSASVSPLTYDD